MISPPSPLVGLLHGFSSVAAARIRLDGTLVEASPAFAVLLGRAAEDPEVNISSCFLDPPFPGLAALSSAAGEYRGPLRFRCPGGLDRTVPASVQRDGEGILLFVEVANWVELIEEVSLLNASLAGKQGALARIRRDFEQQETVINAQLRVDPVTGLANRRKLEERLDIEVEQARRYGTPLCIVIVELESFAEVITRHGPEFGNEALKIFSRIVNGGTRPSDLAARMDGGRFAVVLPHITLRGVVALAERIRAGCATATLVPVERPLAARFGAAEYAPGATTEMLLRCAGEALTRDENAGSNGSAM